MTRYSPLALFFVIALAMAPVTAQAADNRFVPSAVTQPDAPVRVLQCDALEYNKYVDTRTVPPVDQLGLVIGVKFENFTSRVVTAVKFKFVLSNPFGDASTPLFGINQGTYSPGVLIQPAINMAGWPKDDSAGVFHLTTANTTATTMLCSVQSVKFDDGSIWQAAQ